MAIAFWILLAVYLMASLVANIRHFNPVSPHFLIPLFFFVPCSAYFLGLSDLISNTRCVDFYLVLIEFLIVLLLDLAFFGQKYKTIPRGEIITKRPLFLIDFLNCLFFGLYFLENLIAAGVLFPKHAGIDIHTVSITGLAIVTRALFVFVVVDILAFVSTKKIRFALWAGLVLLAPFVLRNARLNTAICLLQLVGWAWMAYKVREKNELIFTTGRKIALGSVLAAVVGAFVVKGALMTNERMSQELDRDASYHETSRSTIDTSNDTLDEILAFLYGYTAFSFDNLQNAIEDTPSDRHNYWGKYSFKPITCGVLRLHNIFHFSPYEPGEFSADVSREAHKGGFATVPTALFDFYYDFGWLAFVPMIVCIGIWRYIVIKRDLHKTLIWDILLVYYTPFFGLVVFQNLVFQSNMIFEILMLVLFVKLFFEESSNESPSAPIGLQR